MKMHSAAMLAVIGCGVAHAAGAARLPAREPGLWQSTTTVLGADGKPLANAQNVVTVSCVDPSTDAKFFTSDENTCSSVTVSGAGAKYVIDGSCTQGGKPMSIHETLDYASARSVALKAVISSPAGAMTVTSQLQWQGQCLAGMEPGDEGSMVDGAFSKADNINDPGGL